MFNKCFLLLQQADYRDVIFCKKNNETWTGVNFIQKYGLEGGNTVQAFPPQNIISLRSILVQIGLQNLPASDVVVIYHKLGQRQNIIVNSCMGGFSIIYS